MRIAWTLPSLFYLLFQGFLSQPPDFPLQAGTYWVYAGYVAWTMPDSQAVQRQPIQWRMEVTGVISRYPVVVAVLKGHPLDLIGYEPKRQPGTYVIVEFNRRKYYLLEGGRAQVAVARIKDESDALAGLVRESELFLETPVWIGQRFCETESLTRADGLHCWTVDEERTPGLETVQGVPPAWNGPDFAIFHRSLSSHTIVGFAPGIGLTSFDYGHHGTVSEVQLKLSEFGRKPAP